MSASYLVAAWNADGSIPDIVLVHGSPDSGILPGERSRWGFEINPPAAAGERAEKQLSWGIQQGDKAPLFWVTGDRTAAELVIITLTIADETQRGAMRTALRAPSIRAVYGDDRFTTEESDKALEFSTWLGKFGLQSLQAGLRPWAGERVLSTPAPAFPGDKKRPTHIRLVR